jgi:hypothetical protein
MLKAPYFWFTGLLLFSATTSAGTTLDPFELVQLADDRLTSAVSLSVHVEKPFSVINSAQSGHYPNAIMALYAAGFYLGSHQTYDDSRLKIAPCA